MAKVIKSAEADETVWRLYERDAVEVPAEAEMADDAADPAAIMEAARKEAEQRIQEAYAEGLRQGKQAGEQAFRESVAEAAEALRAAGEAIRAAHQAFLDSLEPQVVQMALRIAGRILEREAKIDPDVVRNTVEHALRRLGDQNKVIVRINPADLDALRTHKVALLEAFDGVKEMEVVSDDAVSPGGCVAESEELYLDAQFNAQIERLLEQLMDQVNERT